jgi:hypothetical protein
VVSVTTFTRRSVGCAPRATKARSSRRSTSPRGGRSVAPPRSPVCVCEGGHLQDARLHRQ